VSRRGGTDGAVHAHVDQRQRRPRAAVAAGRPAGAVPAARAAVSVQALQVRLREDPGPLRQVQGRKGPGEEGPCHARMHAPSVCSSITSAVISACMVVIAMCMMVSIDVVKAPAPKPKVEDGIFGTSGGIGFTKENELFVGRVAMLGFAVSTQQTPRSRSSSTAAWLRK
jgi:hypothetical protein